VKVLQANLRLNACRNVSILPLALADKRGLLRYDDSAGNSGNILESSGEELADLLQSCLVYAVRLDDEIEPGETIDLIKMDIEGAEYIALLGMERLRKRSRPIIISELAEDFMRNVSGVPLGRYLDELLAEPDYRLGVVHPTGPVELFGRATQAVLEAYARQESMCLDIVAYPADKEASIVAAGPRGVADPGARGG
jgi:FkbM family methyltransferase